MILNNLALSLFFVLHFFTTDIEKDDEGTYTCSASNQFGSHDASATIVVTGIVTPVIAFMSPLVELKEGETLFIRCTVVVGNPPPLIE